MTSVASLLCAILGLACNDPSPSWDVARYGLVEAPSGRPTVRVAIGLVRKILPDPPPLVIEAGWSSNRPDRAVPVHAVGGQGLGRGELVSIYSDCRCILVKTGDLDRWLQEKVGSGSALMSVDPGALLAYMLLHEIGHFIDRDESGAMSAPGGVGSLNRDDTAQKDRETAADRFAATSLKDALQSSGARGLSAGEVTMALSNLSWNLSAHRLLDDFGATSLGKPQAFWDRGYSHPNIELRILTVNALVSGSDVAQQLPDDFLNRRKQGPTILFRKQDE
ncbi:hypothetical protein [Bradyrhizobium sp. SRS-191]|uniref:hypothetical protein n=1 Tax=Bradyrhizobium sp. SRS-191 TaxID=2962606 RepID=UPI00211F1DC9|nr:hypothetical protein [Bradyrhizobium sp. SRS-191]